LSATDVVYYSRTLPLGGRPGPRPYDAEVDSDRSDLVATGYEAFYAAWGKSPTLRRIWREHVTGPDYPEDFAHISFLSLPQLRSLTEGWRSPTTRCLLTWHAELAARLVGCEVVRCPTRRDRPVPDGCPTSI
jgi:hypothetical protein